MHAEPGQSVPSRFRMAEIVAALSLATDLGTGKQLERGLRTCLLGVRLGHDGRSVRCPADHRVQHRPVGDAWLHGQLIDRHSAIWGRAHHGGRHGMAPIVMGSRGEMLAFLVRHFASDQPPNPASAVRGSRPHGRRRLTRGEQRLSLRGRTGDGRSTPAAAGVRAALGCVFERWDGAGSPRHLMHDDVPIAVRVAHVAWDIETLHAMGGPDACVAIVRKRAGGAFDPQVVARFCEKVLARTALRAGRSLAAVTV